jgi:hypothetical protein
MKGRLPTFDLTRKVAIGTGLLARSHGKQRRSTR